MERNRQECYRVNNEVYIGAYKMEVKRIFLIVLDSVGIGALPDAAEYGDEGSNTLKACWNSGKLKIPNLSRLGIYNIDGASYGGKCEFPTGSYGRMKEMSKGKDTTIGHWEIAGIVSPKPLPTYPGGFPKSILDEFTKKTGREVLCNMPFSGTEVIKKYGKEHADTGKLIVYTSADSVFQIAAHEGVVPLKELYNYCGIARDILQGDHGVGRVIARPFAGRFPNYARTPNRHDFSLLPPNKTICDLLCENQLDVIGVGKIYDIFAGRSITESIRTRNNQEGMEETIKLLSRNFTGLAFINLVDFDMVYGHRNDVEGYTYALNEFDKKLGIFMEGMGKEDILFITADHGCDPSTPSTDHSREYTPMLAYGHRVKDGINIGTRNSFSDIGATILELAGINNTICGESYRNLVIK